jgi:predicted house-cleaning noncanonical NTP pyrophosphatase (MazG superfamily)
MERAIRDGYASYLRRLGGEVESSRVESTAWQTILAATIREEIEECLRQPSVVAIVDVIDLLEAYANALAWSGETIRATREERYAQFGGYAGRNVIEVAATASPEPFEVVERERIDPQILLHATRIRSAFPETIASRVEAARPQEPTAVPEHRPQIAQIAQIARVRPSTHLAINKPV